MQPKNRMLENGTTGSVRGAPGNGRSYREMHQKIVRFMMGIEYPSLLRRYFSSFLDGLVILSVLILSAYIFDSETQMAINIRVGLILFMFFVYEPIFTAYFCTLGQQVTGIRVRTLHGKANISLIQAYIRIVLKLFLGLISFFTIPFSRNKRAIHDMAVGSLVIHKKYA